MRLIRIEEEFIIFFAVGCSNNKTKRLQLGQPC